MKQNKQEQWEIDFDKKFNKDGRNATKFAINPLPMDIKQFISQSRQEAVEKALTILDKAEAEHWFVMPDTTANWKTWKRIRNAITDLGGDK